MAALLAAEEAHLSGFFGRIVNFYTRAMRVIIKRPWTLAASSVVIIILSFCLLQLPSNRLSARDG